MGLLWGLVWGIIRLMGLLRGLVWSLGALTDVHNHGSAGVVKHYRCCDSARTVIVCHFWLAIMLDCVIVGRICNVGLKCTSL